MVRPAIIVLLRLPVNKLNDFFLFFPLIFLMFYIVNLIRILKR